MHLHALVQWEGNKPFLWLLHFRQRHMALVTSFGRYPYLRWAFVHVRPLHSLSKSCRRSQVSSRLHTKEGNRREKLLFFPNFRQILTDSSGENAVPIVPNCANSEWLLHSATIEHSFLKLCHCCVTKRVCMTKIANGSCNRVQPKRY